jgi:hypothetical protein
MSDYDNDSFDPWGDWHRPNRRRDPRHFPQHGGGRQMRHPYYDPIIYPRMPDKTINLGYRQLERNRSASIQTLTAQATAWFPDPSDAVVIQEVWVAEQLSTFTELFRQFHRYLIDPLPPGQYIGWIPRDKTWRRFHIELLDVICGQPDEFVIEELGIEKPWFMREQLTVSFRIPQEFFHPAGEIVAIGV